MLEKLLEKLLSLFSSCSPESKPTAQIDVIKGCDPTAKWLAGEMPSYNIDKLIEHLDFRSSIHETYYGHIINERLSPYSGYGDANFQLWAIEGYQNAIYYLRNIKL